MELTDFFRGIISVLSGIFALQLITYEKNNLRSNKILSIFMFSILCYMILRFFLTQENIVVSYVINLSRFFIILIVHPLFYFYIKSLVQEDFKFVKKYYFNFLPATLMLLLIIVNLVIFQIDKDLLFVFFHKTFKIVLPSVLSIYHAQHLIYLALMIHLLIKHRKNIFTQFSYTEKIKLNWLWVCLFVYFVFNIADLTSIILFYNNSSISYIEKLGFVYLILFSLFIAFLGYFGVNQTVIYKDSNYSKCNENEVLHFNNDELIDNGNIKYATSKLTDEKKKEIIANLVSLMNEERLYTDCDLSLNGIASKLDVNRCYLSQTINEHFNKNFYQFINEYRVEYAQTLLADETNHNLTIEALGKLAGFKTPQSLISSFKKYAGMTPSQYLKISKNK